MSEQTGEFSEILDILKENPRGMSVTELADAAHINRNTIARYMDKLLISGRVEMRTFGKAKVFFLSKRIPVSAMLNLSSEMVLLIDADLTIIQANEALLTFLSCTADDIAGSCIYNGKCGILCSDVLTEQIKSALRGEVVRGELRLFKNDEECVLDQRIYPMALPDGRPGVTLMLDDISERVKAEAALERSEAMFRRLVETVHDVIWSVDENSVIQYISPQILSVAGYEAKEMIGRRFSEFMPDGANERFSWELCSEISRENGFSLLEFPLITKSGRKIYCEFSGTPSLLEEDRTIFLGYNGALRDVSDQRKAERGAKRWKFFLDSVLDNIPGIITVTDPKTHQYYYVNRAADEFLGIKRASLLKMTSTDVLSSIGAVRLINADANAASFQKRGHVMEELVHTVFGDRYISARVLPMTLSLGREYLITIVHDITDEVADRRRQELTRELAFTLEGVMTAQDIWTPAMEMLPKISGFESVAVYQRSLFSDYVLYRSEGGAFASAVQSDSILDRVIRKGDPAIFDKYRMELLPAGSLSLMEGARSLVLLPVVVEGVPVACIVLGSVSPLLPDSVL
ncbi:MAG: PAS domain S-box protein, partial [Methanocorpusculum sp.]|nr:PAS domain S-box protein [Methanocorpusculum sp.]